MEFWNYAQSGQASQQQDVSAQASTVSNQTSFEQVGSQQQSSQAQPTPNSTNTIKLNKHNNHKLKLQLLTQVLQITMLQVVLL